VHVIQTAVKKRERNSMVFHYGEAKEEAHGAHSKPLCDAESATLILFQSSHRKHSSPFFSLLQREDLPEIVICLSSSIATVCLRTEKYWSRR